MSWLSKLTHTEGMTPDFVKKIGDQAAGFVVSNVPGGSIVNGLFDLTNTRGGGPSLDDLLKQTGQNMQTSARVGVTAANTAAQAGQAYSTASTGLQLLLKSPVGLAGIALALVLILRKR